jgi:membrane protein implicated in regulation of membrane protease activity
MSNASVWWILAAALVGIELLTGTIYLLMIALGLASAALAAHGGFATAAQLVIAALVGGGGVAAWHTYRQRHPTALRATANKDVNMDIGETVHVTHWGANGNTHVQYRGAQWAASLGEAAVSDAGITQGTPAPGPHRIAEVIGSRLILVPAP